jgi:hypothetical protein
MIFGAIVYGLCTVVAACCAGLLVRAFVGSRARLLLWGSVCFALLAINNLALVLDLVILSSINLFIVRNLSALLAVCAMLYGLVCDER